MIPLGALSAFPRFAFLALASVVGRAQDDALDELDDDHDETGRITPAFLAAVFLLTTFAACMLSAVVLLAIGVERS